MQVSRRIDGSSARSAAQSLGRFLGPATLVSVGYMDPGNWATDLEAGSKFGHRLLWILVASNAVALVLQRLAARLGIVTGLDLASACRAHYSKSVAFHLWLLAEIAIVACDLAEVVGSAVALNLLFGLPLAIGALLTVLDVFVVLALGGREARTIERLVLGLVLTIAGAMALELVLARPSLGAMAGGLVPRLDRSNLYVGVAMLGATVMPHNLYLHSSLVRGTRGAPPVATRRSLRASFVGALLALNVALLVNAAILSLSASAFGSRSIEVTDLAEAHRLLAPLLGTSFASILFAVALLLSGQSATITGTLAGQAVMDGFVQWRLPPAWRRAVTRGLAVVPAVIVLSVVGDRGTMTLLVVSQIVLSLQLPFAVVPLMRFTNSRAIMGRFANGRVSRVMVGAAALLVTGANGALLFGTFDDWRTSAPHAAVALALVAIPAAAFLGWIFVVPFRSARELEREAPPALLGADEARATP